MAKWDVEVTQPYGCSQEEAVAKVKDLLAEFKEKNASVVKSVTWNANGTEATAEGTGFNGLFTVDGGQVTGRIKLGFIAKMMKGKVEAGLKKQLAQAFA